LQSRRRATRTSREKSPALSPTKLFCMAEVAQSESVPARLAAIREQLSLLADYL